MKPELIQISKTSISCDLWLKQIFTQTEIKNKDKKTDPAFEPFKIYSLAGRKILIDGYRSFVEEFTNLPEILTCLDYSALDKEKIAEFLFEKYFLNSGKDALKLSLFFKFLSESEIAPQIMETFQNSLNISGDFSDILRLMDYILKLPASVKNYISQKEISFRDFQLFYNYLGKTVTPFWRVLDHCSPSWNQFKDIIGLVSEVSTQMVISPEELLNRLLIECLTECKNSSEFLNYFKEKITLLRYPLLVNRKMRFDKILKKNNLQKYIKPLNRFCETEHLSFEINLKSSEEFSAFLIVLNKLANSEKFSELFELI